jgi:hypothetical protein
MKRVLVALGVVVALGVALVAWLVWPRGTTPVDDEAARAELRAEIAESEEPEPASLEPGAYTYAAEGDEMVRMGALPEENRLLPTELSGLVAPAGEGCFKISLDRFAEHTESTTLCDTDEGVRLAEHRKTQTIGAISPEMVMTCDPNLIVTGDPSEPPAPDPLQLRCTLEVSGGPMGVTVDLQGTATRGEVEQIEVGDEEVDAVPVTLEFAASGSVTGGWTERMWLESTTNLPVRIERELDLSGPVSFQETSTLVLQSMQPEL